MARGYTAVRPETLSLPAQARLFRAARIVLGEDGSGLHNIIFSEPGCALGVISVPDRINLWHLGLCQAMRHRISYVGAEIAPDGADGRRTGLHRSARPPGGHGDVLI
ncbi:MAG: glycosyltransferase 61 family protein [Thermomicrobiales bacterium]